MGRIISIFSPKGGVGKTTITLSLAESFQKDYKILVVEFDFSPGDFATLLGVDKNKNILLAATYGYKEIMQKPPEKNYFVIAGGFPETHEMVSTSALTKLLNESKNEFEYILFDIQPGLVSKAVNVLNMSDIIIIVLEDTETVVLRFARILKYLSTRIDLSKMLVVVNKYKDNLKNIPEKTVAATVSDVGKIEVPWDRKILSQVDKLKQLITRQQMIDNKNELLNFMKDKLQQFNITSINSEKEFKKEGEKMIYINTGIVSLDEILKQKYAGIICDNRQTADIVVSRVNNKDEINQLAGMGKKVIVLTNIELEKYAKENGMTVFAGEFSIPAIIEAIDLALQGKSVESKEIEHKENSIHPGSSTIFDEELERLLKDISEHITGFIRRHTVQLQVGAKENEKLLQENTLLKEKIVELENKVQQYEKEIEKLQKIKQLLHTIAGD